ncbi:MAG: Xaa-Pro peptidase family protein [Nitrososphaerota archaeon]|nr:Xaa-Pro peptidase family protein [Candidatus Calditenuaceae archaeon]MDW8073803.1 Xaa-Pro peptidase family protein [Nitrososphaerota archaeon]
MGHKERLEKFAARLELSGFNAYICVNESNVFYFTGLPSPATLLIRRDGHAVLYVSPMNYGLAEKEAPQGVEVAHLKMGVAPEALLAEILSQLGGMVGIDSLDFETHRKISGLIGGVDLRPQSRLVWDMRMSKDTYEVEVIREACSVADKVMRAAADLLVPGIKESEVKAELTAEVYRRVGQEPAFMPIVAFGERSAHPHGPILRGAARDRVLKRGDVVVIDLGVKVEGYCSDLTRTFYIGSEMDERLRNTFESVIHAKALAQNIMRPGVSCSYVDDIARDYLSNKGLDAYFIHSLGHGVGIDIHEPPRIGPGSQDQFVENNVVTCEPGVYILGEWGVRMEDTLLVTEEAAIPLTSYPLDEYLIY